MSGKQDAPIGVGALTVLMVLLVLTLAVFSVLTYTSARADLALSTVNAETIAAYYAADAEAAERSAQFREGLESELETTLPMTATQSLHIHLVREVDGSVRTLAWKTIPAQEEVAAGHGLPVFDGTLPVG